MENVKFGGTYVIRDGRKHKGLNGRLMVVTKASKKPGMVNGFLFHEKKGTPQKVEIAIPFENLEEVGVLALIPSPTEIPVVVQIQAPKKSKAKTKKLA